MSLSIMKPFCRGCFGLLLFSLVLFTPLRAETKFQSAEEAWRVGAAFYNSQNYAAAREPFEAALALAPDEAYRLKVHEALLAVYRTIPESEPFIASAEYIIKHSTRDAQQSLTRRALLAFVYQRGLVDGFVKRHEEVLAKEPNNRQSLFILSELYSTMKREPAKAADLIERLAKVDGKEGQPLNVLQSQNLARQYTQAKKFKEAAELYEQIAPLDEKLAAWNWKEAAACRLKLGERDQALAAAMKAHESEPEARNDQLAHFWHRNLADTFLELGKPELAIPHYEQAIEKTKIQGYIDGCLASLAKARELAEK